MDTRPGGRLTHQRRADALRRGHSYGGPVALIAALKQPHRVRVEALYGTTLFALVDANHPPPNGADGIRNTAAAAQDALDLGKLDFAAECFIDFWAG